MTQSMETIVVGAGQAGLCASYHLSRQRRPHLLLEYRKSFADTWRNERWDSFTLVTPNAMLRLPGYQYAGDDPGGFLRKDDIVRYIEGYVSTFHPPVRLGVRVHTVSKDGEYFLVETSDGTFVAENVIVATGLYQFPRVPTFAEKLPENILQLHTSQFRNPSQLPDGAVLVVGSGQSGCQITEELYQSGRRVYLSTGKSSGRLPRRYRGRDFFSWFLETGFADRTVDQLPSPKAKFAGNPHVSGRDGGHTLNLHRFASDGVRLLGRAKDVRRNDMLFFEDLYENLEAIDAFEQEMTAGVDRYIEESGLQAPSEELPRLRSGYDTKLHSRVDLAAEDIRTVIWATGYGFDFSWIQHPVFDGDGYPMQHRGVTDVVGLYFVGMHWLYTITSGNFVGVGDDAAHIVSHILKRAS